MRTYTGYRSAAVVDRKFQRFGIQGWRVVQAVDTPTGDTARHFKDAVAAEGGPVFGDVVGSGGQP